MLLRRVFIDFELGHRSTFPFFIAHRHDCLIRSHSSVVDPIIIFVSKNVAINPQQT